MIITMASNFLPLLLIGGAAVVLMKKSGLSAGNAPMALKNDCSLSDALAGTNRAEYDKIVNYIQRRTMEIFNGGSAKAMVFTKEPDRLYESLVEEFGKEDVDGSFKFDKSQSPALITVPLIGVWKKNPASIASAIYSETTPKRCWPVLSYKGGQSGYGVMSGWESSTEENTAVLCYMSLIVYNVLVTLNNKTDTFGSQDPESVSSALNLVKTVINACFAIKV